MFVTCGASEPWKEVWAQCYFNCLLVSSLIHTVCSYLAQTVFSSPLLLFVLMIFFLLRLLLVLFRTLSTYSFHPPRLVLVPSPCSSSHSFVRTPCPWQLFSLPTCTPLRMLCRTSCSRRQATSSACSVPAGHSARLCVRTSSKRPCYSQRCVCVHVRVRRRMRACSSFFLFLTPFRVGLWC